MKIRLYVSLFVVISCIALMYGSNMGYWHFGFVFIPIIIGFAILFWGVVNINSQVFVKTECSFEANGNEVMLTFDDGPDPEKTPAILNLLEKYKAKGVFFCIGKNIDAYPETAALIVKKGHIIGSHSYNHGFMFDMLSVQKVVAELHQSERAIKNATGKETKFFRPPYGITNPNIEKALRQFKYRVLGWNLRSFDTLIHNPKKLEKRVLQRIKPGTIILLHDTAPAVIPVLETVLEYLKENNYQTKLP